ncbi:MAG: acetyl-CoA acetyltransferase [Pseudomonadota bacterium]
MAYVRNDETTPVIAAIGEAIDRPRDLTQALEPVALIEQVLRAAEDDAGCRLLHQIDRLHIIGITSWRYSNPCRDVCVRLDLSPKVMDNADMGGDKPTRLIHRAATDIRHGRAQMVAIAGGEAQNSFRKARRSEYKLDWSPRVTPEEAWGKLGDTTLGAGRAAATLGIRSAAQIYPLFENAYGSSHHQTPTEGLKQSADLWSRYAAASQDNPYAWSQKGYPANEIAEISESNRMINFPYPKLMVANDSVNMAATVIVTSLAFARRLGLKEDRLTYIVGGSEAEEPADFLQRPNYHTCPAQSAVLDDVMKQLGRVDRLQHIELYSCFPVVPKMALEALRPFGLSETIGPTVTGGLTFFGGPMNNYMTHACCAMVRRLRGDDDTYGLLYGQGGVMTKHHGLLLAASPNDAPYEPALSAQDVANRERKPAPTVADSYTGSAQVETYTAFYDRQGDPTSGLVIARTPQGERVVARTADGDHGSLELLTDFNESAVGAIGQVRRSHDGTLRWFAD